MESYCYEKGQHCPVEHLIFQVEPEHVEEFLQADHEVWTLGEAACGEEGRIPFLSKEVWLNDNRPGEVHVVFVWESMESWKRVADPAIQEELSARFAQRFPYPCRVVRCVEEEENYGIHRWSRFTPRANSLAYRLGRRSMSATDRQRP